jgi:glycine cleavage system transcriptional repressor
MKTRFDNPYVLNVLSEDHPGIVAAVSDVVGRFQGNIDAVSQTVLGGHFSLVMVVSFPRPLAAAELADAVQRSGGESFQVNARPLAAQPAASQPAERFVLTAFGDDKPGIIARLSRYLSGKDVNIVDLQWNVQDGQFVMVSQLDVPARWDILLLVADLEDMGRQQGFTVRLQHENVFVATNQLRMAAGRQG